MAKLKYESCEDRIQGLVELFDESLRWAIELAKDREHKGYAAACDGFMRAQSAMQKELEIKAIIDDNRMRREGTKIVFELDLPEKAKQVEA